MNKKPNLLDIVRLDGRWAQVKPAIDWVRYLDGAQPEARYINWDDYTMVKDHQSKAVYHLQDTEEDTLTEEEISQIYWDAEQEKHPQLKLNVRVFAEYVKKN